MKTARLLLIAAVSLLLGLTSCSKDDDGQVVTKDGVFSVTLSLKTPTPAVRADGPSVAKGEAISVSDGYLFFAADNGKITDVYTIGTGEGEVKGNGTTQLEDVPSNSTVVHIVGNCGTATTPPVEGMLVSAAMANVANLKDNSVSGSVLVVSKAALTDAADGAGHDKEATITLATPLARIEINGVTFRGFAAGKLAGIFINGYSPTTTWAGNLSERLFTTKKAEAVEQTTGETKIYHSSLNGIVFDLIADGENDITSVDNDFIYKSATAENVYGYYMFASEVPQIFLKLEGVKIGDIDHSAEPRFINVTGFVDAADSDVEIDKLVGGMVYRIDLEDFVVDTKHKDEEGNPKDPTDPSDPNPGVASVKVKVTVDPLVWDEHKIKPII